VAAHRADRRGDRSHRRAPLLLQLNVDAPCSRGGARLDGAEITRGVLAKYMRLVSTASRGA
jgi:hypothetical protein